MSLSPPSGPSVTPPPTLPAPGFFPAFWQLIRLPNVFTAWADIGLGAIVTGAWTERPDTVLFLLLASTCLYWAGMVWNDYFDLEQDQRERSYRPLPSGRIGTGTAAALGVVLLGAGVTCAALADLGETGLRWHSLVVGIFLAAAVLAYDAWLKRTWAGPIAMGTCRFLNVLLGLSVVPGGLGSVGLVLALVVGLYIAGVTWFARTEARQSNSSALLGAAGVMLSGLLLSLAAPALAEANGLPHTTTPFFPYLLVGLGFYLGLPLARAISSPSPARVQAAVKRAILGLILLDAVLATSLAGLAGIGLAALLLPALYLGRWLYST
jgi:4-hydroxybenzoate polyprenyltransferase